jgi:hypothetical protein
MLSAPLPNAAWPADSAELFPFVISYDAPDNVTNVSGWLPKPAGKSGFVRAVDGRLATDAGPIRFWATNLCFDACFPSHEEAERVSARMARLGINCVRMHHMDSRSIWGESENKTIIDPERLELLDYLIYQLKLQGIYTNINLHVSRTLGDKEGFPQAEQKPKYDKGIGNFEPRMIELQKKYARDLLTHVNPYTKTTYADEPAVAMVEISNEDALFDIWNRGDLDELPDPYATTYRKLWNSWLANKYGTTAKLRKVWNVGASPLGDQLLADPEFRQPMGKAWAIQTDGQAKVDVTTDNDGPDGQRVLRVAIEEMGREPWIPQLWHAGLGVKEGQTYTLSGQIRASEPRPVGVNCMMTHEPWQRVGLSNKINAETSWTPFRLTFVATVDDGRVRITFTDFRPGVYELTDVSFRPGGIVGLEPGQKLENASVPVVRKGRNNLTQTARHDFVDFMWDTERDYWWGMYRFLKDELKVRSIVSGTQLNYGPVHIQAELDYLDAHSYFHHPVFPGRPWDPKNWYVRNLALVNSSDGGTLSRLASRRVAGMAYTVSEYNHPAPNSYAAEGFPMIAAFGRFQKWDGIFTFTYSHNREFEPRRLSGYFDIKGDPGKIAHHIASSALFLRGDADEARSTIETDLHRQGERDLLHKTMDARSLTADNLGLDLTMAMRRGIALNLDSGTENEAMLPPKPANQITSDTGQLRWDFSEPEAGFFIADTPRTRLFTGFVCERTFWLGEMALKIGKTRLDWATITLTAIDGADLRSPGRILLAATGDVQNTGAKIEELGESRITLGNRWGDAPVLCEGIEASIALPVDMEKVRLFALDMSGDRKTSIPVRSRAGKTILEIGPEHKTLWYEIEIAP